MDIIINFFFNKNIISYCDAPRAWQLGIQDPASPIAEGMISFHNYLMFFLVVIGTTVFWLLYVILKDFNSYTHPTPERFTHSSVLEIVWTIIPAVILLLIAVPSFTLLYSLDEIIAPLVTLKVIGHQWYWSYEYSDYLNSKGDEISYDSYMVPATDLKKGCFRLLEVDHRVCLPARNHVRVLVTSSDVIHSWAVPALGIKIDATPGRLSQVSVFAKRAGLFFGQCSEICGVNHGFMPIAIYSLPKSFYGLWIAWELNQNPFERPVK